MAFEFSAGFQQFWPAGVLDQGSLASLLLDSAFVFETSGDTLGVMFVAPVSQANGTLSVNAYCAADSGTSSDFNVQIRNGAGTSDDTDRPEAGGSTLGTIGADVDANGKADSWVTFSDITNLTLVAGQVYFLLIENKSASPGADNAAFAYRGSMDGLSTRLQGVLYYRSIRSTNGISTDPTAQDTFAPIILKFDDGTIIGNPYVASGSSASGTDYRGCRITPVADMVVSGYRWVSNASPYFGTGAEFAIFQGASTIVSLEPERAVSLETFTGRFDPVTLLAGVDYDVVIKPASANSTTGAFDMGVGSVPADVKAAKIFGTTYVTGATAGSFTETEEQIASLVLLVDSFVSGGGGGGIAHIVGQGGIVG